MFGVKGVASALKEMVELGGRVSDDTLEWLNKLLGDELDDVQENAKELLSKADKVIDEKVAEVTAKLDEVLARLDSLENNDNSEANEPKPPIEPKNVPAKSAARKVVK